jgi:hypothetical protein
VLSLYSMFDNRPILGHKQSRYLNEPTNESTAARVPLSAIVAWGSLATSGKTLGVLSRRERGKRRLRIPVALALIVIVV